MSSTQAIASPWPKQTPPPTSIQREKRKRVHDSPRQQYRDLRSGSSKHVSRQSPANEVPYQSAIAAAKEECYVRVSNAQLSCFPTGSTQITQRQWVSFVWNSRLPQYAQQDLVNIYLFHGESGELIESWPNTPNPEDQSGSLPVLFDDKWLGTQTLSTYNGTDIPWLFYFVVTPSDKSLEQTSLAQSTFTAVQTTHADSILALISSSSAAAAAASSSRASVSRDATLTFSSPFPSSTTITTIGGPGGSDGGDAVQGASNGSAFPRWAIAVIVVLGFLAIVACCVLIFLIMRRLRRRNQEASNRGSMGSASPMMAHAGNSPASPLMAAGVLGGIGNRTSSVGHRPPSVVSHNGASSINSAGDTGPFSGADAAIMANAFREALRKPDFAGRPAEEGESPETKERKEMLLNRELAEEGRDIRSVSSSRGVTVETLSDNGTVNDSHHR